MDPIIQYFVQSGISLAVFFLLYRLLLRKETFFMVNRYFLITAMFLSTIVPLIRIQSPFLSKQITVSGYKVANVYSATVEKTALSDYLLYIYLAGVAILLIKFLFQLLQLIFLIRKFGITELNGQKFIFTDNGFSDFTFFSLIFIDKSKLNLQDLDNIITHERVHIEQYHTFDLLLAEFFTIVQWFNPFVWPYKRAIRETHEYLADNAVIAQGCDVVKYQMLIFERFVGVRLFNLANNFHQSQIKRRIKMMQKKKSAQWSQYKALLLLPIFSLLILAFARPKALFPGSESIITPFTGLEISSTTALISIDDDDVKKKEEIKKLESFLIDLKEKYKNAETDEDKEEIKKKAMKVQKKLQYLKSGNEDVKVKKKDSYESDMEIKFEQKRMELKKMYVNAETEEDKAKIKEKIGNLDKKRDQWRKENEQKHDSYESDMEAKFEQKRNKLKQMYVNAETEEEKAKIKEEIGNLDKKRDQWRQENEIKRVKKKEKSK